MPLIGVTESKSNLKKIVSRTLSIGEHQSFPIHQMSSMTANFAITALFRDFPRQIMQKIVLANIDTAGTTNRSPCKSVHRSLVAHGIGARCTQKAVQSTHSSKTPNTNAEACSGKYRHSRNHKQIPLQHGAQISCSAWYRGPLYSFLEFGPGGPTRKIYQDALCSNKLRKRKHAG